MSVTKSDMALYKKLAKSTDMNLNVHYIDGVAIHFDYKGMNWFLRLPTFDNPGYTLEALAGYSQKVKTYYRDGKDLTLTKIKNDMDSFLKRKTIRRPDGVPIYK